MDSLSAWIFDVPTLHHTADGMHTFHRVVGRPARPDVAMAWGVPPVEVYGEALLPEDALAEAMRKAARVMDEAGQRRFEASAALLRGGLG